MPNLVSRTRPSLQMFGKTQTRVFPISGFLVKSLIKKNCHNSGNSDDIGMKLGPELNFTRETKTRQKIGDEIMSANCDVNVNLEQLGKRIPDI